jgi:hypothetical protein
VHWVKQLLALVHQAHQQGLSIGYITPELVWVRGSKVWLGGVGIVGEHKVDFTGLLATIKTIAGDTYEAMPWHQALEQYVTGELEYGLLIDQLEQMNLPPPEPKPQPKPIKAAESKKTEPSK